MAGVKAQTTRLLRLISLALVLALTMTFFNVAVVQGDPGWYNTNWLYRQKITIDSTRVSANMTDFPVLINLASDSDLAGGAQNDGDDILFTASDETTKLSHEIEKFDGATGELVAWVKVPSLSSSTDTDIYMYYGNASVANQQDVTGTWNSSYEAVWHLSETGTAARYDSTASNYDGTPQNYDGDEAATGQIDGADDLDGADDYLDMGDITELNSVSAFTISGWVKQADLTAYDRMFHKLKDGDNDVSIASYSSSLYFEVGNGSNSFGYWSGYSTVMSADVWYYLAAVYDGSGSTNADKTKVYTDGVERTLTFSGTIPATTANLSTYNLTVSLASQPFDGTMDEVRVSNIARSAEWIETSYNNQSSPGTFYSKSSEEIAPMPVGGEIFRINKLGVLMPWVGLTLVFILIGGSVLFRQYHVQKVDA